MFKYFSSLLPLVYNFSVDKWTNHLFEYTNTCKISYKEQCISFYFLFQFC